MSKMETSQLSTPSSTDTEEWTVLEESATMLRNPKITVDDATDDDNKEQPSQDDTLLKTTGTRRRRLMSNRSEDTDCGHETDEESICVISESEADHDRIEDLHVEYHEKLTELLKNRRKIEEEEDLPKEPKLPPRRSPERERPNTQVIVASPQNSLTLREVVMKHRSTISFLVIALLAAGLAGFFSHASLMIQSYRTQSDDVAKFLSYERRIADLEAENYDLKLKLQIFEERWAAIEPILAELQPKMPQAPTQTPETYAPSGSGKETKRVKTRFDKFKRPPVAAGGDEETVINVHVSPMDEFEWEPEVAPKITLPPEGSSGVDVESIDLSNFEPIGMEVREEAENRTFQAINVQVEVEGMDFRADLGAERAKTPEQKREKSVLKEGSGKKESQKARKDEKEQRNKKDKEQKGREKEPKEDRDGDKSKERRPKKEGSQERRSRKEDSPERKTRREDYPEKNPRKEDSSAKEPRREGSSEKEPRREGSKERDSKKVDFQDKKSRREDSQERKSRKDESTERKSRKENDSGEQKGDFRGEKSHKRDSRERKSQKDDSRERKPQKEDSWERKPRKDDDDSREKDFRDDSRERQERKEHKSKKEFNHRRHDDDDDDDDSREERKSRPRDSRERNFDHSGEQKRDKRKKHDKRPEGSGVSWHEKRAKFRDGARHKDDNWYLERQFDREMKRNSQEKDNWLIERNLERELMRGFKEGSAERIK